MVKIHLLVTIVYAAMKDKVFLYLFISKSVLSYVYFIKLFCY